MTAEAVALNKSAVAMAADSTVTISSGRQGVKTYDTANKLFEMVKGVPVGIMIYSNAEMNGVPWETIVKAYRADRTGTSFPTLREYVDDLLSYLNTPVNFVLPSASEDHAFELAVYEVFLRVFKLVDKGMKSCLTKTGRTVKKRVRQLLIGSARRVAAELALQPDGNWPGLTAEILRVRFGDQARSLVSDLFANFGLPRLELRFLEEMALSSCLKNIPLQSESGIVIAGFGDREVFPSFSALTVRGRLAGVTRIGKRASQAVTFDAPGDLVPFAQDEMARQWITGINEATQKEITRFWADWVENCEPLIAERIRDSAPGLTDDTVRSIALGHRKLLDDTLDTFFETMNEHLDTHFLSPLRQSIALLPKEELALMAESMVNLASLRQRTTVQELETVGGETDVALISRGDGFVWLKRKHYFSLDLNPAWPWRQGGNVPVMSRSRTPDTQ